MNIYFDSCSFIRGIEGSDEISKRLLKILYAPYNNDECLIISSVIAYTEVRTGALKRFNEDPSDANAKRIIDIYFSLMVPYFFAGVSFLDYRSPVTCADITIDIAGHAAELRAKHPGLKTPDALHIATAAEFHCDVFVSDDVSARRIAIELGLQGVSFLVSELDALVARIEPK